MINFAKLGLFGRWPDLLSFPELGVFGKDTVGGGCGDNESRDAIKEAAISDVAADEFEPWSEYEIEQVE